MKKWLLLVCALTLTVLSQAQGRLLLEEDQVRANLVQSKPPVLPPDVHHTGKVVVLVAIGTDGRVVSAKADSGPSMLRDAAVDAVKKWRFKPFTVHGDKVVASSKITVDFTPTPSAAPVARAAAKVMETPAPSTAAAAPADKADAALQQYKVLEQKCHTLVAAHADPAQQVQSCRAAARQAETLQGENRFLLQRSADVFAATALMRTDDLKAAITYGSRAIAVVAKGHDDDSGASAAYTVRGQARAFAGDLHGADADLTEAEAYEQKALLAADGKPVEADLRSAMKALLLFHAQLLKGLKQPGQAAAKTDEASKL